MATLRDIAKEAGTSVASVSKVLHGGGASIRVGEKLASHIRQVASEMNYVPNVSARQFRTGRTNTIGLIFENFGSISAGPLYYVYLFDAVATALFKQHYRLTILPEVDANAVDSLRNGLLDGVIWCKLNRSGTESDVLRQAAIPIVALNSGNVYEGTQVTSFVCDNHQGSFLAVDHLADLGHKRILFVMEKGEDLTPDALARLEGFRTAMAQRGLRASAKDVVYWDREVCEFSDWWPHRGDITAIYAWNEGMAGSVLRHAKANGVSVPEELSVVGFDSTAYCDTTEPRLTAVKQPIFEMATMATEQLLAMLRDGTTQPSSTLFPCTFDVRGSTSAPRM